MGRTYKNLLLLLSLAVVLAALYAIFRFAPGASDFVWNTSQNTKWLFPLVVVAAIIDSINPCAFSVLLLTIAFLFSLGKKRSGIIRAGTSYIFGLFVMYVLIGLGIVQALHIFNTPHFMAKAGAILIILLGLIEIIGELFQSFPIKLKIPSLAHKKMAQLMEKASLPTAFLLGGFVGLCEFPCTGGPYLLVLGLLHDRATYLTGGMYLLLYNLIFVLPLVIILTIASNTALLERIQSWKKTNNQGMRLWGGLAMIILGLIIFMF